MKMFKRISAVCSTLVFAATLSICGVATTFAYTAKSGKEAKNVIILIPDGCSQSIQTLARWYKGEKLAVDEIQVAAAKHEMANSVITGSAAASTAFATGHKTTVRFLSIGPREDDVLSTFEWPEDPETYSYKPLATVMEGAKLDGLATGLISTSRFTHATPAGFACHSNDRGNEHTDISEQMVYNEIDLIFGGGERNLVPKSEGGKRTDEENLLDVLEDRGYTIAKTKTEMDAVDSLPVFGMYAWSHMDAEIDRPIYNPDEPSLAEMTAKAIELLSEDEDGFILMVEGSQVDWGGHNNDPIYMVTDFIAFDDAVKVALDYAKQSGDTLVLAYPDHNCGGMDIGNRAYNWAYTGLTVDDLLFPLYGMTVTSASVADAIGDDDSDANMIAQVEALWGLTITADDCQEIRDLRDGDAGSMNYALARVISKNHTAIGWTSHGHNAEDVPVWAYGPGAPQGVVDNTELAEIVADVLDLDMEDVQEKLYVNLEDRFKKWGINKTDPENPVVKMNGNRYTAEMPCSKDILNVTMKDGSIRTYDLEGLVVYVPNTDRVYIPEQAAYILERLAFR